MADPIWVDGTTPLNSVNMTKLQTRDEKGAASGYATLDATTKVPVAQLPDLSATYATKVSYGTSLPGSPVDGQEAILVDSVTVPTYQWRFRYNAANTTGYRWEFVGGNRKGVEGVGGTAWNNTESTTSITAATLTTPGPAITVPRAGVYLLEGQAICMASPAGSAASIFLWVSTDGAPLWALGDATTAVGAAGAGATLFCRRSRTLPASTVVELRYATINGTASFSNRNLWVTPVIVS